MKQLMNSFFDTLEDLGFKLISTRCANIEEVRTEVEENGLKEYDLLLVDYTLKNSASGDKIIEFIRNIKDTPILTDVLFYSSAIENVRDSMYKLGLEGVYTADRKFIESKFELVVNTTIKKLQEVNPMRGLIMAETSDLDELMLEITNKLLKSKIRPLYEKYILDAMKETVERNNKAVFDDTIDIVEKISDTRIFTSFHRAKCINKLYKVSSKTGSPIGMRSFFESYNKEVIPTRNNFAHVKEIIEDGEKVLISHATGQREIFNESRCVEIRKILIKYRDILEDINKNL